MALIESKPHLHEYGETASLLLQMADEMGFDVRSVRTVPGGFEVPDAIAAILTGVPQPLPQVQSNEGRTPPASWAESLPEPGVEIVKGRVVLTEAERARLVDEFREIKAASPDEVGRETIRAWAKENGFEPAPQGKLKQAVIEAYHLANPTVA